MWTKELIARIRGRGAVEEARQAMSLRGRNWRDVPSNPPEHLIARVMRALQFTRMCQEGLDVFTDRNNVYEDAFTQIGLLGICAELIGCVNRLKPLVLRRGENLPPWQEAKQKELLRNVLVDTHNFANIALMMLEEENWAGVG